MSSVEYSSRGFVQHVCPVFCQVFCQVSYLQGGRVMAVAGQSGCQGLRQRLVSQETRVLSVAGQPGARVLAMLGQARSQVSGSDRSPGGEGPDSGRSAKGRVLTVASQSGGQRRGSGRSAGLSGSCQWPVGKGPGPWQWPVSKGPGSWQWPVSKGPGSWQWPVSQGGRRLQVVVQLQLSAVSRFGWSPEPLREHIYITLYIASR